MNSLNLDRHPFSLYLHIPYCISKCPYCDFNSHVRAEPDWQSYEQALISELDFWVTQKQFQDRNLHSVFFGGGTPSLAPASLIARVLAHAHKLFGFESDIEIKCKGCHELNSIKVNDENVLLCGVYPCPNRVPVTHNA